MSGSDIDRLKLSSPGLIPIRLWNELIDYVHSALITSFNGGSFSRTPAGTILNSTLGDATGNESKFPFDSSVQSGDNGTVSLTIWPGLVNGILADNMFDAFTVDSSSLWYIKAVVTTDGNQVTGVTLVIDTSPADVQVPATNAMPSVLDVLVGLYRGGMSYNIAKGNVGLRPTVVSQSSGDFSGYWNWP